MNWFSFWVYLALVIFNMVFVMEDWIRLSSFREYRIPFMVLKIVLFFVMVTFGAYYVIL